MAYETTDHGMYDCEITDAAEGAKDTVNSATHEVKDHHENPADAERQVRILNELEKEE